jgi:ABC-type transporter Mla subunit MlaD
MNKQAENLRAVLTCLVKLIDSNNRRLDEIAKVVFSLQGTMRGLDPTFDDVLNQKAEEIDSAVAQFGPIRDDQFDQLYRLIDSLDLG